MKKHLYLLTYESEYLGTVPAGYTTSHREARLWETSDSTKRKSVSLPPFDLEHYFPEEYEIERYNARMKRIGTLLMIIPGILYAWWFFSAFGDYSQGNSLFYAATGATVVWVFVSHFFLKEKPRKQIHQ